MKNVVALVLGGGRGTRLHPLTLYRSKPAVPLGAKYRLIDIPLSNCLHSQVNKIYVLTQFMSVSLHRHIRQTYRFDHFNGGFVELLAAQQTMDDGTDWYQGTADAVRKNLRYLEQSWVDYVVILSGDQLYRMDYREMLHTHQQANAAVTIAALPVAKEDATSLGVMQIDDNGRVTGFVEKPKTDEELATVRSDPDWIDQRGVNSNGREYLASMGIYVFNRDFLVDALKSSDYQDFGKELFPSAINTQHVQSHLFDGYWEDIGTIRAFYEANLSLADPVSPFQLESAVTPIYSRPRFLPPTLMEQSTVRRSLIADGCRIGEGAMIDNSVIGLRCHIGSNVTIRNSIIMGADYYETPEQRILNAQQHIPDIGIGDDSHIESAILDKNCRIGKGVHLTPQHEMPDDFRDQAVQIRDGVTVVLKEATVPDGYHR